MVLKTIFLPVYKYLTMAFRASVEESMDSLKSSPVAAWEANNLKNK